MDLTTSLGQMGTNCRKLPEHSPQQGLQLQQQKLQKQQQQQLRRQQWEADSPAHNWIVESRFRRRLQRRVEKVLLQHR